MPELPEVEGFRRLLLPLVGNTIVVRRLGENHRIKLNLTEGESVVCTDVLRRGKQLCLVVMVAKSLKYMYLHMGMTGRIRVIGRYENWGDIKEDGPVGSDLESEDETSPPKYTHLIFSAQETNYTAYFCDPRKFGSCYIATDRSDLDALAPDALLCVDPDVIDKKILPSLTDQRLGIKAILLDQKRAVSGVGNWIADEVLYQCGLHPDQTKLNCNEAKLVWKTLQHIASVAVNSQINDESYPAQWLFHYRWTGKKAARDAAGRTISFVTSGGRTSAVVLSQQKLYARKKSPPKSNREVEETTIMESASPIFPSQRKRSRQTKNVTGKDKACVEVSFRRKSPRLQGLLP